MMVDFQNIYKIYAAGDTEVHAIDGVTMQIDKGEFVAIVGASGSGKSSCMNIIGCLDVPTSGSYFLDGEDVSCLSEKELAHIRNESLGFIFQQYNLIPKLTVLENVELPLIYRGIRSSQREKMAKAALERVGLSDRLDKTPNQLSGGQQQRVSIARALAGNPPIILADEPTGALDSKTGQEVIAFMKELNREGNTIILITHDNTIAGQAPRLIRLQDGRIIEDTKPGGSVVHPLSQRKGADA